MSASKRKSKLVNNSDRDIPIGFELRLIRTELKLSMKTVSEALAVSENYISLIERDKQVPSDHLIREIAKYYNMDEKYLFDRFGRIPLTVAEEIQENEVLSEVLYEISSDNRLTDEQKDKLYRSIKGLYQDISNEKS